MRGVTLLATTRAPRGASGRNSGLKRVGIGTGWIRGGWQGEADAQKLNVEGSAKPCKRAATVSNSTVFCQASGPLRV
ncbi:hypothetical protein EV670_2085 [Rivibacter subsaxonicus]|uniref:Uncharacterized protein n=1 Tax=Rivibacter subsaxonicus TaxID=457575 RepID=A0A4Q7VN11_9BURK|nr:hypothetical protein EV670_2085 [Rivibacter subsaxonicus]